MSFQLVIVRGRSDLKTHRLGPGVTTIGRQEGCQLQIKGSLVSRRHCELHEKSGQLQVKDLSSSNGTYVNGVKVEGTQALSHGDELTIGGVKFRIERVDGKAATADRSSSPAVGVPVSAPESDGAIPFDDQETVMVEPGQEPVKTAAMPAAARVEPEPDSEPAGPEIGEDAVAEFLLDLDLDDDDKV